MKQRHPKQGHPKQRRPKQKRPAGLTARPTRRLSHAFTSFELTLIRSAVSSALCRPHPSDEHVPLHIVLNKLRAMRSSRRDELELLRVLELHRYEIRLLYGLLLRELNLRKRLKLPGRRDLGRLRRYLESTGVQLGGVILELVVGRTRERGRS